jgi:predicted DNA binding CopG/RHH family protein
MVGTLATGGTARAKAGATAGGVVEDTRTVSFRLPESIWRRWKIQVASEGTTVQDLTRKIIEDYLDAHEG